MTSAEEKERIGRGRYTGVWNVSDGDTPLLASARVGSFDVARVLIANGADVKAVSPNNSTVVSLAMQTPNIDLMRLLIEKGASVAVTNTKGDSPLMWAIGQGDGQLALATIKAGVDINCINIFRETALAHVSGANNLPKIALLLARTVNDVTHYDPAQSVYRLPTAELHNVRSGAQAARVLRQLVRKQTGPVRHPLQGRCAAYKQDTNRCSQRVEYHNLYNSFCRRFSSGSRNNRVPRDRQVRFVNSDNVSEARNSTASSRDFRPSIPFRADSVVESCRISTSAIVGLLPSQ